jgi:uncharacterized RDD family membrane protein YckC
LNEEVEKLLHREGLVLTDIKTRAFAFFIDEVLLSLLLMVALWERFTTAETTEEMIIVINSYLFEYMLIKILYQTFFTMMYGASIGKIVTKIRVIEIATLENPSFLVSLNRAIFRVISEMFFYMGFLWAMMNPLKEAWHDKTAKTLVINA